ncbi:MAG TPA: ABC transporter ATP-binding protein [Gemmatimonadaceae bacterium]|nr:ABC transporter ATP-binding protein [Gemmatimonadaceae bacterium]
MQVLTADCVSKSFRGRQVLSSATLRAVAGELRVLFGRNGVGKSTLLKIAAGWLTPDSGNVYVAGRRMPAVTLAELAVRGVFYLPDHDLLSPAFSVRRQLEMIRSQFSGGSVADAAEQVGISEHLDRRPATLSGGERRRAELAAALVRRPTCLLADEPYRGVPPKDADDLTRIFVRLVREGTAVVLTGHEAPTLLDAADHVTWCTSGTTYELGPPAAAVRHDAFRREYLGHTTCPPEAPRRRVD